MTKIFFNINFIIFIYFQPFESHNIITRIKIKNIIKYEKNESNIAYLNKNIKYIYALIFK